jgi:ATP-dependent DNA ligase
MLRDAEGNPVSRAGKPLYNLDLIPEHITDCEIFDTNWETSVSAVRTHDGPLVLPSCAYSLRLGWRDIRLEICDIENPTAEVVAEYLAEALARGDEGLVIYQGDVAYKVKPKENYDVPVTGATEGKGKYAGLIGALITPKGKVSGMTDQQRRDFTLKLPEVIEVESMMLTKNGKFRHPRFVRVRFDKSPDDCK